MNTNNVSNVAEVSSVLSHESMSAPSAPEKIAVGKPPICGHQNENNPNPTLLLPSPIITKRTRTASTSARAMQNPIVKGVVKYFSRSKGHGFITPNNGGEDIFCHVSDVEGEYVPLPGDEVKYRLCAIPPKFEKHQAVHVRIINLTPEIHRKWEDTYSESVDK